MNFECNDLTKRIEDMCMIMKLPLYQYGKSSHFSRSCRSTDAKIAGSVDGH